MFNCLLAEFRWSFVSEALGWQGYPRSMNQLISSWLPGKFGVSYQIGLSCFAGLAWVIWNTRNKICIKKSFPNKLIDMVYLSYRNGSNWRSPRWRSWGRWCWDMQKKFKPLEIFPNDVGFI
jgi:hypothetical protein